MSSAAQPSLQIDCKPGSHEGEQIIKVRGPLVISNFFEFQTIARANKAPLLIIDLEGVPYMDSSALGAVLGIHVSTGNKGTKYALIHVAPRLESLFELSGVRDTLVMFPTLADAERALL
jgi:anti-anti-sigma factor